MSKEKGRTEGENLRHVSESGKKSFFRFWNRGLNATWLWMFSLKFCCPLLFFSSVKACKMRTNLTELSHSQTAQEPS